MLVKLSSSDIERLAKLIREITGNEVRERNYAMLESRMRTHVMRLDLSSMEDYWKYFAQNEAIERDALQSLMTTHYTFFFREYAHFEVLEKWLGQESSRLRERHERTGQPLRIWSAACSRGQEAYSLAMFLEKRLNIPFEIVGTDIDTESVAYARNGVYPLKEVNTIPYSYLADFWKKGTGSVKEFAAVHPKLKSRTRFETLNLLEIKSWKDQSKFDVIFCRNVFIYFSDANVRSIALDLADRLADRGLFISGMSEPLRFEGWNLESIGPSCYQKCTKGNTSFEAAKSATPVADAQKPSEPTSQAPAPSTPTRYRVLAVDDSPTIQTLLKKIFAQDPDCERVDTANNGKEARAMLDAGKYDLVTLDIHMPEVNGIEFLERLYQRKIDPPVLMVSSVNRADEDLATRSLVLGAFDYVEKPAMNNLARSATEILTKTKMALRMKERKADESVGGFDKSISHKIVVPDASLCLRVVVATASKLKQLEQVVKGQAAEYRSPALLVLWMDTDQSLSALQGEILGWTQRQLALLRQPAAHLKPNHVYLADGTVAGLISSNLQAKSVSIQFLDMPTLDLKALGQRPQLQVLVDEALNVDQPCFLRQYGLSVSDITPATSFASLSLEFFADLRKAS